MRVIRAGKDSLAQITSSAQSAWYNSEKKSGIKVVSGYFSFSPTFEIAQLQAGQVMN